MWPALTMISALLWMWISVAEPTIIARSKSKGSQVLTVWWTSLSTRNLIALAMMNFSTAWNPSRLPFRKWLATSISTLFKCLAWMSYSWPWRTGYPRQNWRYWRQNCAQLECQRANALDHQSVDHSNRDPTNLSTSTANFEFDNFTRFYL